MSQKQCEMLFIHLEQLGIPLAVECRITQEEERLAGVHDRIRIRPEVFGALTDHGHAAKVLADGLNGSERIVKKLLFLHRRQDLFDEDVLGHDKIGGVEEHIVDPPQQSQYQGLDQVGILRVVHSCHK